MSKSTRTHHSLKLIVGLGNPGQQYAHTRHNAGFWFVERLAHKHNISLKADKKYHALTGRGNIHGKDIRLLLPQTFMNASGKAVAPFVNFYDIQVSELLVAHDELDFTPGKIQLKTSGGHGGHNGLRDIVPHIGKEFHRLRIGIGHPGHRDKVASHVLNKASTAEQDKIDASIEAAINLDKSLILGTLDEVKNQLNGFKV